MDLQYKRFKSNKWHFWKHTQELCNETLHSTTTVYIQPAQLHTYSPFH